MASDLHVEFRDRLQTLIDPAHEQDSNFHDRWRQNGDAITQVGIEGGPHTVSFTVSKSPQATADQHDRELVPSLSYHSPL